MKDEEDVQSQEEEEQEEVIAKADEGEILVHRRALSSQWSEKEEQREYFPFLLYCSGESMLVNHQWG